MPFLDSLDIANRALQHCGLTPITSVSEDSQRNTECSAAYDKVRRAELRRNVWRFAVRRAAIRPMATSTLVLVPSDYSASKTYLPGEVVQDTNRLVWVSQIADNIANSPGGNNEAWDMYFGSRTAELFQSGNSYFAGELVYVVTTSAPNGYQVYMSLTNGNSDTPGTATAYSATAQYKHDDVVSSGGSQWRSLLAVNIGTTPADGPLAYNSATMYSTGQTATGSDNYIYSSVGSGNVGYDPTTDGGIHWTNTGVLNAWSRSPTLLTSSLNWRPLLATLKNVFTVYPIGAGPSSQAQTKNIYPLPFGFLREAPQNQKTFGTLGGPTGVSLNDWEYDGDYIITETIGTIILRFVADISKVSAMDDMFCEGLACRLAAAVCPRMTQSDGKLQTIASEYKFFMGEARLVNSIEEGPTSSPDDEYLTVRG